MYAQVVNQRDSWFFNLIVVVMVCNLLDALCTLAWVRMGVEEANPLMRTALEAGPVPFLAVKMGLVGLGLLLFWGHRDVPWVRKALVGLAGFYTAVVVFLHFPAWLIL